MAIVKTWKKKSKALGVRCKEGLDDVQEECTATLVRRLTWARNRTHAHVLNNWIEAGRPWGLEGAEDAENWNVVGAKQIASRNLPKRPFVCFRSTIPAHQHRGIAIGTTLRSVGIAGEPIGGGVRDGAAGAGAAAGRRALHRPPAQPHRGGPVRAEQSAGARAGGGPGGAPCARGSGAAQRGERGPVAGEACHVRQGARECDRGVSGLAARPSGVLRGDAHGRRHGGSERMGACFCNVEFHLWCPRFVFSKLTWVCALLS